MGVPDQSNLVKVVGPNNPNNPGGEASLDIQVLFFIFKKL